MATDNVGTPASRTEYRFATGNSSHTEQASAGKTLGGTACSTTWTDAPSLEGRVIGVLSGHNQTGTAADLIHEEWRLWSWVTPPGLPASIKAPQLPSTRSLDKDNFVTGQKLTATTTTFDSLGNPLLRSSLGETVPISSPTCALDEAYLNDEVRVQATWATNLPEWIFTPSVVKACADSGCATILRQNEIYYDGSSSLGVVSVGDVTKTRTWVSFEADPVTWTQATFGYDAYGNVTTSTDEEGAVTTFTYADTNPVTPDSFAFPHSASIVVSLGKSQPVTLATSRAIRSKSTRPSAATARGRSITPTTGRTASTSPRISRGRR